jgi:hypothetical protein
MHLAVPVTDTLPRTRRWHVTPAGSAPPPAGPYPPASVPPVGSLKRVRAHDGSLDLVCTQQPILKILKIAGLTEVFGIYQTVDQAIAAAKRRR